MPVVMELLTIEVIGPITLGNTFLRSVVGIGSILHDLHAIFPIILTPLVQSVVGILLNNLYPDVLVCRLGGSLKHPRFSLFWP